MIDSVWNAGEELGAGGSVWNAGEELGAGVSRLLFKCEDARAGSRTAAAIPHASTRSQGRAGKIGRAHAYVPVCNVIVCLVAYRKNQRRCRTV